MNRLFQDITVFILLAIFSLKVGLFPVVPGETEFPFAGPNAIYPSYPPVGIIFSHSHESIARFTFFSNESNRPGPIYSDSSDGQFAELVKAASIFVAGLNKIIVWSSTILLSLQAYLIIFPFHAFW